MFNARSVATKTTVKTESIESENNNTLTADDDVDSSNIFDETAQGAFLLSKKKREYLEQKIEDRSGQFDYEADPIAYKKARK